jgi:hypothetical protein
VVHALRAWFVSGDNWHAHRPVNTTQTADERGCHECVQEFLHSNAKIYPILGEGQRWIEIDCALTVCLVRELVERSSPPKFGSCLGVGMSSLQLLFG